MAQAQEGLLCRLDNTNDLFNSRFEGRWTDQQARLFLAGLVTIVTLGIGFFWASMWYLRWVYSKSVINGKRLEFRATGSSYFLKCLIWFLFSIITLGIYAIFIVPKRFQEFLAENLYFEGEDTSFEYNGGIIESMIIYYTILYLCLYFAPLLLFAVYPTYTHKGRKAVYKAGAGTTLVRIVSWSFMLWIPFYFLALPCSINKFVLSNTTMED